MRASRSCSTLGDMETPGPKFSCSGLAVSADDAESCGICLATAPSIPLIRVSWLEDYSILGSFSSRLIDDPSEIRGASGCIENKDRNPDGAVTRNRRTVFQQK